MPFLHNGKIGKCMVAKGQKRCLILVVHFSSLSHDVDLTHGVNWAVLSKSGDPISRSLRTTNAKTDLQCRHHCIRITQNRMSVGAVGSQSTTVNCCVRANCVVFQGSVHHAPYALKLLANPYPTSPHPRQLSNYYLCPPSAELEHDPLKG